MPADRLDFSALRIAVDALDRALGRPLDEFVRDSVIQRFEFTYELAWKMLRRVLLRTEGAATVDALSRRDLFRLGQRKGLIEDSAAWFEYHEARNQTSHTYDVLRADEVYAVARRFAPVVRDLLARLERAADD